MYVTGAAGERGAAPPSLLRGTRYGNVARMRSIVGAWQYTCTGAEGATSRKQSRPMNASACGCVSSSASMRRSGGVRRGHTRATVSRNVLPQSTTTWKSPPPSGRANDRPADTLRRQLGPRGRAKASAHTAQHPGPCSSTHASHGTADDAPEPSTVKRDADIVTVTHPSISQ